MRSSSNQCCIRTSELFGCVIADSFEGLEADLALAEGVRMGRGFAKQDADFCAMQAQMHGGDWESVFDADMEAVVAHATTVRSFLHGPTEDLQVKLLLTGGTEDEMFPDCHYERLFAEKCLKTDMATSHIFKRGGHPVMLSNLDEFAELCDSFILAD